MKGWTGSLAPMTGALVVGMAIVPSLPANAHHSFAGFYDQSRIVEVEGVVTSVHWRNPHGSITMEVTDASGDTVEWKAETGSVSVLRVRGFDREFVRPGDRVRIAGEAALRRENALYARNMLLEGGEEVLLSIGIEPRWTDPNTGELLEARFDDSVAARARASADGIFRVWSTVFEDPDSFPMFKGGYPLNEAAGAAKAAWDPSSVVQLGCEPKGMPSLMITPFPIELVERGGDIAIRFEEDDAERIIHMAPGARRSEGFTALLGYSTGRWQGDALVVETDGVSARYLDGEGTPLGPEARFVERFAISEDESRLDYSITIMDPNTFTEPFDLHRYFVWRPELTVGSYNCSIEG